MDTNIVIVLVASVIAIIAAVLITAKVTTNRLKKKENRLSPEELEAKWENSFSHKLGVWSLEHTPKGWPK